MVERPEEPLVRELGRVKIRGLIGGEKPAERRKRQFRLPVPQGAEHGLHAFVGVVVAVPSDGLRERSRRRLVA